MLLVVTPAWRSFPGPELASPPPGPPSHGVSSPFAILRFLVFSLTSRQRRVCRPWQRRDTGRL